MITEDYVSFETAKLLKKKGFNIPITSVWVDHSKMIDYPAAISTSPNKEDWNSTTGNMKDIYFSAPTLQMAMRWLREVHNRYITILTSCELDHPTFIFRIERYIKPLFFTYFQSNKVYDSYEDAVEAAIQYCLKHLIDK